MFSPSIEPYSPDLIWIVVVGYIIAFVLAFGIGANDVANSFGTSVGAKVLTIRQACLLATIFEIAGAVLIGYKVSDTIRKGILDVNFYKEDELDLMLGSISALSASAVWLLVATFLNMPISGTHSIVGATVGFSLAVHGTRGIQWWQILTIVLSWFISPLLSGLISSLIFLFINYAILRRKDPTKAGLICLPFFYGFTTIVNVFSIVHDGSNLLHLNNTPLWLAILVSVLVGIAVTLLVHIFLVPWHRKRIVKRLSDIQQVNFSIGESSDTTPNTSPSKRQNNRLSQLSTDEKQLAVITESAEMLPLSPKETPIPLKYTYSENLSICTRCRESNCSCKDPYVPITDTVQNGNKKTNTHITNIAAGTSTNNSTSMMTPNTSTVLLISDKKSVTTFEQTDSQLLSDSQFNGDSKIHSNMESIRSNVIEPEVTKLFSFLQVMTAVFGSFAHGGNDVSNAIGPLITLWLVYTEGSVEQKAETPIVILLYGGVGISAGLWILGRRVIKTVGEDLTKITATSGFAIELGSAFTVLLASKIGIPISTTHCKVGSVVFVGLVNAAFSKTRATQSVDMGLFRNIISAWIITVPISAALSAGCMTAIRRIVYSI